MNIKRFIKKHIIGKKEGHSIDTITQNIVEAHIILNSIGVKHWLTDGTLLGYYRDGKIFAHEKDADFGVFIEDYNDKIIDAFIKKGWRLHYVFGKLSVGFELTFSKNDEHIDLFFFYKDEDKVWHAAWQVTQKRPVRIVNLIKYNYDKFDLKEIEFLGEKFLIPANTEHYIETKYGNDWRTPVKEWDWAFGPKNAVKTDIFLNWNKKKKIIK